MPPEIKQIKKALEGLALQWKSCEGDLRRKYTDRGADSLIKRYCLDEDMRTNMQRYYETLKT